MVYFPSEFINALSIHDTRLTPRGVSSAKTLLIEERDLSSINCEEYSSLLVLTEDADKCGISVGLYKYIYKYQEVRKLVAEIFEEPYDVRHFIVLGIDECPQELFFDSYFVNVLDSQKFEGSLINIDSFLNEGTHSLYSSALDLLDPPVERILEIVSEQSRINTVDIVSIGIYGTLTDALIKKADYNYILTTNLYEHIARDICSYFSNSTVIKLPISKEAIELVNRRRVV